MFVRMTRSVTLNSNSDVSCDSQAGTKDHGERREQRLAQRTAKSVSNNNKLQLQRMSSSTDDLLRVLRQKLSDLIDNKGYDRRRAIRALLLEFRAVEEQHSSSLVHLSRLEAQLALSVARAVEESSSLTELTRQLERANLTRHCTTVSAAAAASATTTAMANNRPRSASLEEVDHVKPTTNSNKRNRSESSSCAAVTTTNAKRMRSATT